MKKILVIEDNADIRENICELLELDGYEVLSAGSGKAGLELAKEVVPGVIICDIVMNGIDGYAVISELRKDKTTADIPVIILTALSQQAIVEPVLALGVKAFIRKPFSEEDLTECILSCLAVQSSVDLYRVDPKYSHPMIDQVRVQAQSMNRART